MADTTTVMFEPRWKLQIFHMKIKGNNHDRLQAVIQKNISP